MKELRDLVRTYVAGELDYAAFRRELVVRFLTALNADPAVEFAASTIDSECADFSENLISVEELKAKITMAVDPRRATRSIQNSFFVSMFVEYEQEPSLVASQAILTTGTSSPFFGSYVSSAPATVTLSELTLAAA